MAGKTAGRMWAYQGHHLFQREERKAFTVMTDNGGFLKHLPIGKGPSLPETPATDRQVKDDAALEQPAESSVVSLHPAKDQTAPVEEPRVKETFLQIELFMLMEWHRIRSTTLPLRSSGEMVEAKGPIRAQPAKRIKRAK